MNVLIRIAVLLFCASSAFASGELGTLDSAAAEAYRAQDYERAEAQWNRAIELPEVQASSEARARILHNLGNVAMRRDKTLEAVAHYRASLKLRPRDKNTLANLDFARSEAGLDPVPQPGIFASLTLVESERVVLFFAFALFLMLVGEAFLGGAFRPAAAITGLLLLVSLVPWIGQVSRDGSEEALVIYSSGTALRSEPRAGAVSLVKLDAGTEHFVRDELPDWIGIETADGVEGWVKAAHLVRMTR